MASSENVAGEESNIFADGVSDPDLEARLYAEIYYSNEIYEPNTEIVNTNDTTECIVPSLTTLPVSSSNFIESNDKTSSCEKDDTSIDNSVLRASDKEPIGKSSDFGKPFYAKKKWILGESPGCSDKIKKTVDKPKVPKKTRALACKDLWLRPQTSRNPLSSVRTANSSEAPPPIALNDVAASDFTDVQKSKQNCNVDRLSKKRRKALRKLENKKKKLAQTPIESGARKRNFPRRKVAINCTGVTTEPSKYKIISKKQKLNMRSKNSIEESSDSDDSILEVPVPPKLPPPVIQLPDSDDDSTMTRSKRVDDHSTPIYVVDSDSSCSSSEFFRSMMRTSPEPSNYIDDKSSCDDETSPRNSNLGRTSPEVDIVLNCSDVQRGATSLDEIVQIRENGTSDSATTICVNIANQHNTTHERDEYSNDRTGDTMATSLWQQMIRENSSATNRYIDNSTIEDLETFSENPVRGFTENEPNISTNDFVDETNERTTRKRQNNHQSGEFTNFNVPEVPQKRVRGNTRQSTRDLSLTEYFFKPMSKELKAFYNNPWGGENLDICDIQSRMPRNPNCWAILDADLRPPSKRRKRLCQRCQTESHVGKKCPLKAKAPTCYICGTSGHFETRCPQTMCLTCGHKYATFRPTCERCCNLYCDMCNGMGHTRDNCPDLWRRYHNTTTESAPIPPDNPQNVMKSQQSMSCCNCARRGHDETMCKKLRWSQHFPTPRRIISYTNGPNYSLPDHEFSRDIVPAECIDVIDIGGDEIPLAEAENSAPDEDIIYEYMNIINTAGLAGLESTVIRLNTLKSINLRILVGDRQRPKFLRHWQRNFSFNVRVIRDQNDQVLLIIEANCKKLVIGLKKIMMQWLIRSGVERKILTYNALPFEKLHDMRMLLEKQVHLLETTQEPIDILNRISVCEVKIQKIDCLIRTADMNKKPKKEYRKSKAELVLKIQRRNCELVTSMYVRSLIPGSEYVVATFRGLVAKLMDPNIIFRAEDYVELVYLYNEIFTYRKNEKLSIEINKLKSNLRTPERTISTRSITGQQLERNELVQTDQEFPVNAITLPQNSIVSENQEFIGLSDNVDTNCEINGIPDCPPVLKPLPTPFSDAFLTKKSRNLLLPNPVNAKCGKKGRKNSKKLRKGALINLSPKKQRHYHALADETIKMANLSNNRVLQEKAKRLSDKIAYDTAHMSEIELLWGRVRRHMKLKSQKNVNS